jgi:hypothetical protein
LVGKPGGLTDLQLAGLAQRYDYISFEAWDVARGFRASVRAWRNRLKFASLGRKSIASLIQP